ncbi:MAG: hypothetical protein U9Q20_08835 [Campylobacterota bacterium]|nr:hypothetical protein [Campylobacterota bacterium]
MKNSINEVNNVSLHSIMQGQLSNNSSYRHDNFSSLLNNDESKNSEESEEPSSDFENQQQVLLNQAYLNRAFLTSTI